MKDGSLVMAEANARSRIILNKNYHRTTESWKTMSTLFIHLAHSRSVAEHNGEIEKIAKQVFELSKQKDVDMRSSPSTINWQK